MGDIGKEQVAEESTNNEESPGFKKPVLIGRVGKIPKTTKNLVDKKAVTENQNTTAADTSYDTLHIVPLEKELSSPLTYKEPKWSGLCPDGSEYGLEVLKSGIILEKMDLTKKPYYVFGRLANCDVVMAHPTISRHHAVIQYKAFAEDGEPPPGWYLYDLNSTHGTFLNKDRLKGNHYTRVRVGHQIKFGNSTRIYVMLGPDFDCEGESELTVTEIKQRAQEMKLERDKLIKEAIEKREKDKLEEEKKREEQGIDWGMGEDAEDEPDLADNPYAETANEELYLEDPKKTLRGYFEREGHELNYDCEERGVGQFICRVELPMDDARGRPVVAEVIHRGKKKEAVIACALEACRILDRAGLLRQAKHESRRRKERDWSADDYYDSDEDTFLDRTGSVEQKRKLRMQKLGAAESEAAKPLTYDDLVEKVSEIEKKIKVEEKNLERLRSLNKPAPQPSGGDALDAYMAALGTQGQSMANKAEISQSKMNIQKLKTELSKTQRLADVARPAHLPPLAKAGEKKSTVKMGSNAVVYGKRIRLKEDKEKRPKAKPAMKKEEEEFVKEMDSDEELSDRKLIQEDRTKEPAILVNNRHVAQASTEESKELTNSDYGDSETKEKSSVKKVYGPMRPPDDYVIPENYFDQETERDLPEIMEDD